MIQNYLKPHIHNILQFHGYAIAIDLFFKHDFKFRIISTYLPCDDSQLRLLAQNTIIQWIQEAEHKNILPIVMRDFNATNDSQSPSIKSKLLSFLQHNNMYDLASHTNTSTPTWHSNRYNSCIDYIWANHSLLRYLISYTTDDPSTCTCSDHNILISTWEFPYAFTGK